jgi:hypothetical protein
VLNLVVSALCYPVHSRSSFPLEKKLPGFSLPYNSSLL